MPSHRANFELKMHPAWITPEQNRGVRRDTAEGFFNAAADGRKMVDDRQGYHDIES
jgi:hypothetical protein